MTAAAQTAALIIAPSISMDESDCLFWEVFLSVLSLFFLTFFSIFEAALHNLSPFELKLLKEERRSGGGEVLQLLARDNLQVIIPLSFGIQLSFVALAVFTVHVVLTMLRPWGLLWSLLVMVGIIFVFRQLVPRMLACRTPDRILLFLLPLFSLVFPFLRMCTTPVKCAMKWVGDGEPGPEEERPPRDEGDKEREIEALIAIGKEEEVLEKEEEELVKSVLEFGDTEVREVMTPRSEIVAIKESATVAEVVDLMARDRHSRIPVYRENLDQIVGVIYVRNLISRLKEVGWDSPIKDLLINPVFVAEGDRLAEVFKEIKLKRAWMVFVRNEYGGISGLITIEDVLEEIVGDISDEDQTDEAQIVPQGRNTFLVSGKVSLYDLGEALRVRLEDEDCQTIGGLLTKRLGRLPRKSEKVVMGSIALTVLSVDQRKVNRLFIERLREEGSAEPPSARGEEER